MKNPFLSKEQNSRKNIGLKLEYKEWFVFFNLKVLFFSISKLHFLIAAIWIKRRHTKIHGSGFRSILKTFPNLELSIWLEIKSLALDSLLVQKSPSLSGMRLLLLSPNYLHTFIFWISTFFFYFLQFANVWSSFRDMLNP